MLVKDADLTLTCEMILNSHQTKCKTQYMRVFCCFSRLN